MSKSIICEGRTSTEAIENGLNLLKCKREDVEVKVLENEDKKAFFSILSPRVVKVELILKKEIVDEHKVKHDYEVSKEDIDKCKENIEKFLEEFKQEIKDIEVNINEDSEFLRIQINGEGANKLIGYRGEVINALQSILSAIGNKNTEKRVRITVDINEYREKREKTLIELAEKLEKTVSKTEKKVTLEPMPAYERKIIHTALQNSETVTTYSIGEEPHRKIVIEKK